MTRGEKLNILNRYCDNRTCGTDCFMQSICRDNYNDEDFTDEQLDFAMSHLCPNGDNSEDLINKPKHYNREGAMECIDEMILIFGIKNTITYCVMNAHKYRYRAADKNGVEDLSKSDWYYRKAKELMNECNVESWKDLMNIS